MKSKTCFACLETKTFDNFHKHPNCVDGHVNKCKKCTHAKSYQYRIANIEKYRAIDRKRNKRPERRELTSKISLEWKRKDKRRSHAQYVIYQAMKNGTMIRMPCIICGDVKSHAHHDNYDKPKDVIFLCSIHHKARHKELIALGISP